MSSPFLDAPRPLIAGQLSLSLRETIDQWLQQRKAARDTGEILAALAEAAGQEIASDPDNAAQFATLSRFVDRIILARRDANRRRMGGVQVDLIVKQ